MSRSRKRPSSCSPAAFHVAILQFTPRWSDPSHPQGRRASCRVAGQAFFALVALGQDVGRRDVNLRAPPGEKGTELSPSLWLPSTATPSGSLLPWLHLPQIFPPSFALLTTPPHLHGDKRGGGRGRALYFESLHNSSFLWRHRGCLWN